MNNIKLEEDRDVVTTGGVVNAKAGQYLVWDYNPNIVDVIDSLPTDAGDDKSVVKRR